MVFIDVSGWCGQSPAIRSVVAGRLAESTNRGTHVWL